MVTGDSSKCSWFPWSKVYIVGLNVNNATSVRITIGHVTVNNKSNLSNFKGQNVKYENQ